MSHSNRKLKRTEDQCRICGISAFHAYYGVIACEPCKIFFRRTIQAIQMGSAPICKFLGRCQINIETRHCCAACRLAKCLKVGMSKDKLRGPVQNKSLNKALVQVERLPTLNLLQSDQSCLTTDQWILLTNLFYSYKDSSVIPSVQPLLYTNPSVQFSYEYYASLVEKMILSTYKTAGSCIQSNDDVCRLSFDERSIVMRSAVNNICCIGGAFIMQFFDLYNVPLFMHVMNKKYGKYAMGMQLWARKFIDPDVVVMKLAISIFALSETFDFDQSNRLININHIFKIQSKYAEILWKYLLYKYGDNGAIRKFLNMTSFLVHMNTLKIYAQNLGNHQENLDAIIEQIEIELIIHDTDDFDTI